MGSIVAEKPHAVCIPYPAQGHVTPLLKLAKLLHTKGFYITFVNTEFNHKRLLRSTGNTASSLASFHDFRFDTIPDGLPPSDEDATQHVPSLCDSITKNCLAPFRDLLAKLNHPSSTSPPVTYIISDLFMTFTLLAAEELQIPTALFWTASASGLMGYLHYPHLIKQGFVPLKDESDLVNGYLETPVESILGMKNMRLKDLPTFIRTTDVNEPIFSYICRELERLPMASAIIINTFEDLERPVLDSILPLLPPVFAVGPVSLLSRQRPIEEGPLASLGSNLWKVDTSCLYWLDGRAPQSVIYVNFGSVTIMSNEQLVEFAWGLANSGYDFLWVIRPDVVKGEAAKVPAEFLAETAKKGMVSGWCPQEQVLLHPSVGGFLTHGGWNSITESICGGVPMICWPFFAEQQTNCRYLCTEWGVGMEIDNFAKREEVEKMIRELMGGGEKGMVMRNKALEWKKSALRATEPCGSSWESFERVVDTVLVPNK